MPHKAKITAVLFSIFVLSSFQLIDDSLDIQVHLEGAIKALTIERKKFIGNNSDEACVQCLYTYNLNRKNIITKVDIHEKPEDEQEILNFLCANGRLLRIDNMNNSYFLYNKFEVRIAATQSQGLLVSVYSPGCYYAKDISYQEIGNVAMRTDKPAPPCSIQK